MPNPKKITVAIMDRYNLVRTCMKSAVLSFSRIGHVYGASSSDELLSLSDMIQPDIVLINVQKPTKSALHDSSIAQSRFVQARLIALATDRNLADYEHLLHFRAHGYLDIETCIEEIELAIHQVFDKGYYFNGFFLKIFKMNQQKHCQQGPKITPRELEILRLIYEEWTMRKIADQLNISKKTVQNHRTSMMEKLGVKNTVGLIKVAVTKKLISIIPMREM
jgi:two-component system, NarL family, response regulator DegU